jgi:hypothetical protein
LRGNAFSNAALLANPARLASSTDTALCVVRSTETIASRPIAVCNVPPALTVGRVHHRNATSTSPAAIRSSVSFLSSTTPGSQAPETALNSPIPAGVAQSVRAAES